MTNKTSVYTSNKFRRFVWVGFMVLSILLAACRPEPAATEPPAAPPEEPAATQSPPEPEPVGAVPPELTAKEWVLIAYGDASNPVVVEPGTRATANFVPDGNLSGSGGCNSYNTTYQVDGQSISFGQAAVTTMACETGMEQEATYLAALELATGFQIVDGKRLLINYDSGAGTSEQLVYDAATPLTGTLWVLQTYGDPNDPTPSQAGVLTTAVFSPDGTLSGSGGCNEYSTSYTTQDGQITIGLPTSTLMECATGMEQEAAYLAALELAEGYRIADGFLEITYANGAAALRYSSVHLPLENVRWVLTAIDGQPLPDGVEATAIFTPGGEGGENRVNGSAGCNTYFGGYTIEGNNLSMPGPFGTTQMMCDEGIMQVERSFLAGLEGAQTYQTLLNSLTIATASGSMNFRADRTALIGPIWQLTSLGPNDNPQPPVAEANFTATFNRQLGMPSGVVTGGTGCNNYSAVYYSNLQQIKVNPAARSEEACPPALADQMVTYFQGLNEARSYRILGNELQIFYGDQVLNFVATYPPGEEQEQPAGPLTPLNGTTWWLVSSDTFQVIPGSEVTAFFEINPDGLTGLINGSGGCNTYNAEIVGVFQVGPINATQSLCDTPAGVMEQEGAYFAALGVAQSFTHDLDGGTLVISTDVGALVYSSQGPEAVQPLPPTDTPEAVQPLPLAAVINAPTEGLVNQPISFDGSASTPQDGISSYAWDFGDGTNAEGAMVEHAFTATDVYTVTLTVSDAQGGMNSTTLEVTIN